MNERVHEAVRPQGISDAEGAIAVLHQAVCKGSHMGAACPSVPAQPHAAHDGCRDRAEIWVTEGPCQRRPAMGLGFPLLRVGAPWDEGWLRDGHHLKNRARPIHPNLAAGARGQAFLYRHFSEGQKDELL